MHRPELQEAAHGPERSQAIGHEVKEAARALFAGGILIDLESGVQAALQATREAMSLSQARPVYEATFAHDQVLVRIDMLVPSPDGYRLIKVTSSTGATPRHREDCTLQAWVLEHNGVALCSIELAHIDTGFTYQGDGDYEGLFKHVSMDAAARPLASGTAQQVAEARASLQGPEPTVTVGAQCDDPVACPFKHHCGAADEAADAPAYPLDVLPRVRPALRDQLRGDGITDALQVPEHCLNDTQKLVQRCSRTEQVWLTDAAAKMLDALPYPRLYLDFETVTLAVPRWARMQPYRTQVPFQWSCHIESENGMLQHAMFLDVSGEDPRRAFAESLVDTVGASGPVFVYFQGFEKSRIAELAALFPDLAERLEAINHLVIDLLPVTRRSFYHPRMRGSWSIKAVLPCVAPDLDYGQTEVASGTDAQAAYCRIVHPATPEHTRQALVHALRTYCTLDTLAMVRLAGFLSDCRSWRYFMPGFALAALPQDPHGAASPGTSLLASQAQELLHQRCLATGSRMIPDPIAWLQRQLKIGYTRTTGLVATLEASGVLSPLMCREESDD